MFVYLIVFAPWGRLEETWGERGLLNLAIEKGYCFHNTPYFYSVTAGVPRGSVSPDLIAMSAGEPQAGSNVSARFASFASIINVIDFVS